MSNPKSITEWQHDLQENWQTYYENAKALKLKATLAVVVATILQPLHTSSENTSPEHIRQSLQSTNFLPAYDTFIRERKEAELTDLKRLVEALLKEAKKTSQLQEALNYLILESGILTTLPTESEEHKELLKSLLVDAWQMLKEPSGVRVVVEQIIAGGHVIVSGRDSHFVGEQYKGDEAALKAYLANTRAEWNRPDLSRILPTYHSAEYTIYIHNLFTPLDVWRHSKHQSVDEDELIQLRFKAVNKELDESRRSVIEMIASHPYLVITGAAGTGKSYLARYIATCLSYACDPQEAERTQVDGLKLLGNAWIHGAILPIYLPMRNFAASQNFPKSIQNAKADNLLKYICSISGDFGEELERYLFTECESSFRALLILDGLDEVGTEKDRLIIQKVIEGWADRFSQCRILVTSRTYAYKQNSNWRLSPRFESAELAPFSRKQINTYITDWYKQAALVRASSFGGHGVAQQITDKLAKNLKSAIQNDESPLLPLMRQPLLLAMLTLIHETHKSLPDKSAELYEATIDLLNRWMPYPTLDASDETLMMQKLNTDRLLESLKLAAFQLQCKHKSYQKYPGTLSRSELKTFLQTQSSRPGGLGVSVKLLLEYLGTRNGVLLSDKPDQYRFPHLSIQEYMAACALIELYDEVNMPDDLKASGKVWTFPENLAALLSHDPYRWRNVALFVGKIISGNKGQDGRWTLIEELLPISKKFDLEEETVFRIYIAGEIWATGYLKARLPSHDMIRNRLVECLRQIQADERIDAPERNRTMVILKQLLGKKNARIS